MNTIIMDLEFTPVESQFNEERIVCAYETIQIGAIKINENGKMTGRFSSYIKPRYSKELSEHVKELTQITDEMLESAPDFEQIMKRFIVWIGDWYEIYSWSMTDCTQIMRECIQKHIFTRDIVEMEKNWKDLQRQLGDKIHVTQAISLQNAMRGLGIKQIGQQHSALADAENTAAIYLLMQNEEQFRTAAKSLEEFFAEKESLTYSLAGLFEGLNLA